MGLGVTLLGCATGGGDTFGEVGGGGGLSSATTTTSGQGPGAGGDGGGGGSILLPSSCPAGELALGVSAGKLVCDQPGAQLTQPLAEGCRVAFGYRDACASGCSSPPLKLGVVGTTGCAVTGAASTCNAIALGGTTVELLAINTDGDVDSNDRFYYHFSCDPGGEAESHIGPCTPGEWVTGIASDGAVTCTPLAPAILDWAHQSCRSYFGWRDACNGCTSAPAKWGHSGATSCGDGLDPSNLCFNVPIEGEMAAMYSLVTGGDVDDNDTFYFGLGCDPPTTNVSSASGQCPDGQFVRAIEADGKLSCAPPDVFAAEAMERCTLYAGWRDGCSGCNLPPSKWGRTSTTGCVNDIGTHNVCINAVLGGQTVQLFGLNTDGDVDDNDSFFLGFRCE